MSWGLVSSACTSGFACLRESSVFGEAPRSFPSNLEWRQSLRGPSLALRGLSDIVPSSCGGARPSRAWLQTASMMRGFLGLVSSSRAGWLCAAVTEALVVVRFPGELFAILGQALGLGACLLSVTGVGLFARATSGKLGAVRAGSLGSSQPLW